MAEVSGAELTLDGTRSDEIDAADALSSKADGQASKNQDDKIYIYFLRGALAERQKHYDSAEEEFRRILDIDPNNSMIDPISGATVMNAVITATGPTPDPNHPGGVRERPLVRVDPAVPADDPHPLGVRPLRAD